MAYRACAPSIRFRRLPTCRTCDLLVPLISMLQQQLPQHLSHQRPPLLRQLARYLIKTRFRMLFPPFPHRLKHLLRSTHKLRLRLLQVYLPSPSQKIWDTPDRSRPVGAIQNGASFRLPLSNCTGCGRDARLFALSSRGLQASWSRGVAGSANPVRRQRSTKETPAIFTLSIRVFSSSCLAVSLAAQTQ